MFQIKDHSRCQAVACGQYNTLAMNLIRGTDGDLGNVINNNESGEPTIKRNLQEKAST